MRLGIIIISIGLVCVGLQLWTISILINIVGICQMMKVN